MLKSLSRNRISLFLALILLLLALACGCGVTGVSTPGKGVGQLSLFLTDAPASGLQSVNVTIREAQAHRNGKWETIVTFPHGIMIDLLDLRFKETLLGTASLPAGAYTQIRLIVDDSGKDVSNVVDRDGNVHYLKVPSGSQTGLKVHHNFVVPAGGHAALALDVNVLEFVHATGAGHYIINPTAIRVADKAAAGTIRGRVLDAATGEPIAHTDVVVALRLDADDDGIPDDVDNDGVYDPERDAVAWSIALQADDKDGNLAGTFQLNSIPELTSGSYIIEVSAEGYVPWTQSQISVIAGTTTEIDGDPHTPAIDPILLKM